MEIDERFLGEVGLSAMEEDERRAFLDYVQEELEVRVGEGIMDGLSEEKMKEFEAVEGDEEVREWLNANRPDYKEIVLTTIRELKDEISRNKDKIL